MSNLFVSVSQAVSNRSLCDFQTVQLLEDEPFDVLKPKLEELLADQDKNKQRAAAELLAGILNGEGYFEDR